MMKTTDSLELRRFIKKRFFLSELPEEDDNLYELAEQSLAHMASMSPEELRKAELESGCSGASSAMVKKVLLLMSVKKKFGIVIPMEASGEIERVSDIIKYM